MSYHVDVVGSYLRPLYLLDARKKKENNEITNEEFQMLENKAIKEVIEKQISLGLKVVTDGEFRRNNFFVDFLMGFKNVDMRKSNCWKNVYNQIKFKDEGLTIPPSYVENYIVPYGYDKISSNISHPIYSNFEYLKSITPPGILVKIDIPSPLYLIVFRDLEDPYPENAYKNVSEFYMDISKAYTETLLHLYTLGARMIQIDEPSIPIYSYVFPSTDEERHIFFEEKINIFHEIMRPVLSSLPLDMSIAIHICKGNGAKYLRSPFSYLQMLKIFTCLNPHPKYLLLEWDDERAGPFETLSEYAKQLPNTRFFLGFISTKNEVVENEDDVINKINEAAKWVSLDRLGLTTQCGFGTYKEGNPISEEAQWKKVKLIGDLGKKIWEDK